MTELQTKAILAGLFFGVWPLLMNRSGLTGNVSSAVFSGVVFLGVLPLALYNLNTTSLMQANWKFALLAGIAGTIGILAFNGGLAKSTPETVSTFLVLMIVVQVVVPAVYQVILNGGINSAKLIGFVSASVAAYFLSK